MPTIRDENTVDIIAREYCSNGHNKAKALHTVGYGRNYAYSGQATKLYEKPALKKAIEAIEGQRKAKTEEIVVHNKEKSLKMAQYIYDKADKLDKTNSMTGALREMDVVAGLVNQTPVTVNTGPVLDEEQRKALAEVARAYKLKLTKVG